MKLSIGVAELSNYVAAQLNNFFPDASHVVDIHKEIISTLERFEYCADRINRKYFYADGVTQFNHLHGDQYSMFLYLLSNTLFRKDDLHTAEKVFLLNKSLFGIDAFYSIQLPDIFYFSHPLGTILGNASYSDYLVVYQGVTIGSDVDETGVGGEYPVIGKGCVFFANSTVIGKCNIGANVTFAAGSFIRNKEVASNTVVFGVHPDNVLKANERQNKKIYFSYKKTNSCYARNAYSETY